jgi:hypothetical protein
VPVEEIVKSETRVDCGATSAKRFTGSNHVKEVDTWTEVFSASMLAEHGVTLTFSVPDVDNCAMLAD